MLLTVNDEHSGNITSASFLNWYAGIDDDETQDFYKTLEETRYPIPVSQLTQKSSME